MRPREFFLAPSILRITDLVASAGARLVSQPDLLELGALFEQPRTVHCRHLGV
jgi:hypothetical protein